MAEERPYRVVAIADSLALPRVEGGEVLLWEETWHYRLERRLEDAGHPIEVVNCAIRARTASSLNGPDFAEHILSKRPDAVVLQVAVVGCAPRVFSLREKWDLNAPGFPAGLRGFLIRRRSSRRAFLTGRDPLRKVIHVSPALRVVSYGIQ